MTKTARRGWDPPEGRRMQAEAPRAVSPSVPVAERPGSCATATTAQDRLEVFLSRTAGLRPQCGLEQVAETILDAALSVFGVPRGALFLGPTGPINFTPIAALGMSREDLSIVEKLCEMMRVGDAEDRSLVIEDTRSDPRLGPIANTLPVPMRSILLTHLIAPSGHLGVLYVDSPNPGALKEQVLPLAKQIGVTAAAFVENAQIHEALVRENTRLRGRGTEAQPFDRLIGSSAATEILRCQTSVAALLERPLLILGEPGSGRRLVARAIHGASLRAERPFVACDCSVVRRRLLREILFGHSAGAAREDPGLLRLANRGTLYLTNTQLLGKSLGNAVAMIAEAGIHGPRGARRDFRADVRLILASDREWADMKKEPARRSRTCLRPHEWFRLAVPPLRERAEDIPELVSHFEMTLSDQREGRRGVAFTPEALKLLQAQPWPYNIRELLQVVQRALLCSTKSVIDASHIRRCLNSPAGGDGMDWGPWRGIGSSLSEWEAAAVRNALLKTKGNKTGAARLLQIHRNTLDRKLKRLDERRLPASATT